MATFTAAAAQAGVQPKSIRYGGVPVKAVYSFDGYSTTIGTTVQMVKVPKGASVVFLQALANVSGEYTLHIGDSVNDQRYRSHSTYSSGVGTITPTLPQLGYTYSADDVISMKISLASVLTLGGAFYMNVIFAMDP
jgi:hypothetical protein